MPNEQENNNQILVSWTTPEFVQQDKSPAWFWALGIICVALAIVSLLMKNYFFILIIALSAFLIYIQAKKQPRKIEIKISSKKLTIDEKDYEYSEFKSFWIFDDPQLHYLNLVSKKLIQPQIQIPLGGQRPESIREILKKFIPEREQEETLTDIITRKIKF